MNYVLRVCALACLTTVVFCANSTQAQAPKAVAQPIAISDFQTRALMENFSSSSFVNTQHSGEQLYQAICQSCHMPQGQGTKKGAGIYPALAGNPRLASSAYPALVVLNGLHGMPSFSDRLNDRQIAEIANYVRTHFGNNFADEVQPEDVKAIRAGIPARVTDTIRR